MSALNLPKSRLPPQTVTKMRRMGSTDLKLYANDLLSSYDSKARKLDAVGQRIAQRWVVSQAEFFDDIAEELRQIILSGDPP